jgi:hypothetical protein
VKWWPGVRGLRLMGCVKLATHASRTIFPLEPFPQELSLRTDEYRQKAANANCCRST